MKYKEEVLKFYPDAKLFGDIVAFNRPDDTYRYVLVLIKRAKFKTNDKIIKEKFDYELFNEKYKVISDWEKNQRLVWESAYLEIQKRILRNLSL
jgi:hypothetical protein